MPSPDEGETEAPDLFGLAEDATGYSSGGHGPADLSVGAAVVQAGIPLQAALVAVFGTARGVALARALARAFGVSVMLAFGQFVGLV
jgi:hypothetical protein